MKLNKKQVVEIFKSEVMPSIKEAYEQDGRPDYIARSEAWNNFTDSLCKDRQISNHQYNTWTHPAICGK